MPLKYARQTVEAYCTSSLLNMGIAAMYWLKKADEILTPETKQEIDELFKRWLSMVPVTEIHIQSMTCYDEGDIRAWDSACQYALNRGASNV